MNEEASPKDLFNDLKRNYVDDFLYGDYFAKNFYIARMKDLKIQSWFYWRAFCQWRQRKEFEIQESNTNRDYWEGRISYDDWQGRLRDLEASRGRRTSFALREESP